MSPRAATTNILALVTVLLSMVATAHAQELVNPDSPDAIVERYLQLHGLEDLRAAQLRERLASAGGSERLEIAENLGDIYASMLGDNISPQRRRELEVLSKKLFKMVPSVDSFGLRIRLAKARYLPAERIAERWRLELTDPDEVTEAKRILGEVREVFDDLALSLGRRIEVLKRQEKKGSDSDQGKVATRLKATVSQRSSAHYYAGWSGYYLALLDDSAKDARQAEIDLGWMLGADGRTPSLEQLGSALLRYEHVGRSAMAIALCKSLEGDHGGALSWMRVLEQSGELNSAVRDQLFARKMEILARAGRWDELAIMVAARRTQEPLQVSEARLLGVLTMREGARPGATADQSPQRLAGIAVGDLIARGEVAHVLDLLRRFGTLPLGGDGFIVGYVRGLLAYDNAREAHRNSGGDASVPTDDAAVAQKYDASADLLRGAFEAEDARSFPAERARAGLSWGLSAYYRGRLLEAAKALEKTATIAGDEKLREEALWMAVVALDRAATAGNEEARQWGERLSTLYVTEFPSSERAAVLLLRQADASKADAEHAIEVLFAVEPKSPIYEAARRHLGRLLYRKYRGAPSSRRDAEAARFLRVAEELLKMDESIVADGKAEDKSKAAQAVIVRVRQILDVVLSSRAPELDRAERAMDTLERVANSMGMGLGDLEGELAYRRLQIALARGNQTRVEELLSELTRIGGRFTRAAERQMYRSAIEAWGLPDAGAEQARRLVRFGGRVLANPDDPGDRLSQQALLGVTDRVIEGAMYLWENEQDDAMRSLAMRLAESWFKKGVWTEYMLRTLAQLSEQAGNSTQAFDAWNTLSAAYDPGEDTWFEARYNAIRLMVDLEPERAREAMTQHRVLYPSYGPEPFGEKLRALDARLQLLPAVPVPGGGGP
jgi:hypothetical protein